MSASRTPTDALARVSAGVGLALLALGFVALVAVWAWERSHPPETPRFDPERFVALTPARPAEGASGVAAGRERWLMVVNPRCERCRDAFPRAIARAAAAPGAPALEALVVDSPSRPTSAALAPFPGERAWWDSAGVWRSAWRHRVYSEVLRFDARGALLGIDPPSRAP